MLLFDADGRVIASADSLWVPLGVKVSVNRQGTPTLMKYAGRDYLVRTAGSPGYRGYAGPDGWQGQVMIPVDVAFGSMDSAVLASLASEWADGLLSHAHTFCPPLHEIIGMADMIRRVVWNGQVMSAGQEGDLAHLQSVLKQISETGARSDALFSRSIHELFETVLASGFRDAEFSSHLMVDLLDRICTSALTTAAGGLCRRSLGRSWQAGRQTAVRARNRRSSISTACTPFILRCWFMTARGISLPALATAACPLSMLIPWQLSMACAPSRIAT